MRIYIHTRICIHIQKHTQRISVRSDFWWEGGALIAVSQKQVRATATGPIPSPAALKEPA